LPRFIEASTEVFLHNASCGCSICLSYFQPSPLSCIFSTQLLQIPNKNACTALPLGELHVGKSQVPRICLGGLGAVGIFLEDQLSGFRSLLEIYESYIRCLKFLHAAAWYIPLLRSRPAPEVPGTGNTLYVQTAIATICLRLMLL
jgi:hypothetical protein